MIHNWRDLSSTILPPGLVFSLALATGILSKTLLIEKPAKAQPYQNIMQMSGVEIVHSKFETEKHSLSIITADRVEYAGKQINFINPHLTSFNGDPESDLVKLSATNASSNSEMSMVYLNGGAAIKKLIVKAKQN